MSLPILVRPEFWDDLESSFTNFEERQTGLGVRFRDVALRHLGNLNTFPESKRIVEASIRRDLIRSFDFWILFSVEPNHIHVLGLVYAGRDLDSWISARVASDE